jgi:hypothetical protein
LTGGTPRQLRTIAFGTLDGGPWGVAWSAGPSVVLVAASAADAPRWIAQARISGSEQEGEWQLAADGVELDVSGEGTPARLASEVASDQGMTGFDQLCRIRGRAVIGGAELMIDSPGLRGAHDVEFRGYKSIRSVAAWFDSGEGIALLALRPRKAKGHNRDLVTAALLGSGAATLVEDPRLSTTYGPDGAPARAGLELWLDEEESERYPRRAAGEAIAAGGLVSDQNLELRAELFRWRRRGEDGAGVYLLAQAR